MWKGLETTVVIVLLCYYRGWSLSFQGNIRGKREGGGSVVEAVWWKDVGCSWQQLKRQTKSRFMGKMMKLILLFNILTDWYVSVYLLVYAFINKSIDLGRETRDLGSWHYWGGWSPLSEVVGMRGTKCRGLCRIVGEFSIAVIRKEEDWGGAGPGNWVR